LLKPLIAFGESGSPSEPEVMWAIQANLGTTGTPFLGVGSTAQLISPYYWRVGPSNGTLLAYSLIELYAFGMTALGVRNATIVREDLAWTVPIANLVKYYLSTVLPSPPPVGANSTPITFTSDITIAEGATVDAVSAKLATVDDEIDALLPLFSAPSQVTNAWFQNNMSQFLSGINVDAQKSTFFEETQGAAYGEITIHPMPPDIDRTTKTAAFRTAFEADNSGETPSYTAAYAYDAVYILKEAIEREDSFAKADIQATLNQTNYVGAVAKYKFTNEPGPQLILNATLGYDTVPGVTAAYGSIVVHDLWTGSKVGYRDPEYVQTYFAQWQQNGTLKTVWGDHMLASSETFADLEWPIVHSEHGYTASATPGFELPLIIAVLANLAVIVQIRRKKRI